jgi:hypothetical protein
VAVRAESGATTFELSESTGASRFPRWNPDGTAVALVEEESDGGVALLSRNIPPTTGQSTPLTTATAASTEDFRHLEWAPVSRVSWVKRTTAGGNSGISAIPGAGGAIEELSTNGGFPTWRDEQNFAYSAKGVGLLTRTLGSAPQTLSGTSTGEQPKYNRANPFLLYLAATESDTFVGGEMQPLYELFTLSATGTPATSNSIALRSTPTPVTGGEVKSFITAHTWAPDGTYVTYVRAYYYDPTLADAPAIICGNTGAECGAQATGPNVYLQRINPETGVAVGEPILVAANGTLPSVSPDGRFIAYIQGQRLYMKSLNPTDWSLGDPVVLTPTTMQVRTGLGDDHRPRWQPR